MRNIELDQFKQKILSHTSDWVKKPTCVREVSKLYNLVTNLESLEVQTTVINAISSILHTDVTQIRENRFEALSKKIMQQYDSSPIPFDQFLMYLGANILHSTLDEAQKVDFLTCMNKEFPPIPKPDISALRRAKSIGGLGNRPCPPPTPNKKRNINTKNPEFKRLRLSEVAVELPQTIWHPEKLSMEEIDQLTNTIQNKALSVDEQLEYCDMVAQLVHRSEELARVALDKRLFDGVECDRIVADHRQPKIWDVGALAVFLSQNIKEHRSNLEEHIRKSCSECIIGARASIFAEVTAKIAATIQYDDAFKTQLQVLANNFTSQIVISPFEAKLMQ